MNHARIRSHGFAPTSVKRRAPLALAFTVLFGAACGPPESAQNLLFISVDTLRRDHLPFYGYERDTAPELNAFVQHSVVFDQAICQDTNTVPSHASMFTGVYPHQHGSQVNGSVLAEAQVTLAQILQGAGFHTGGFVSGLALVRSASGLERGFDVYSDDFDSYKRAGAVSTQLALDWVESLEKDDRFFLFVHLYDTHGPYRTEGEDPPRFSSKEAGPELARIPKYQELRRPDGALVTHINFYVDCYDTMVHYVDRQIGRLLGAIDRERTAIVITADHGETHGERYHVLDHGGQVFDEQIRIPLILHAPAVSPRRIAELVETVDLLPTLLELLDVPLPESRPVRGRSLVPLMRGRSIGKREISFSTARPVRARHADRGYLLDPKRRIRSARSKEWKLIRYPGLRGDYVELYDLRKDPEEKLNLASDRVGVRNRYLNALDTWASDDRVTGPSPSLPPAVLQQLDELGYLDE